MKHFIDGNMLVIVKDDFEDLQESPAVFMPAESELGQRVVNGGILSLPVGSLRQVMDLLNDGGGVVSGEYRGPWGSL